MRHMLKNIFIPSSFYWIIVSLCFHFLSFSITLTNVTETKVDFIIFLWNMYFVIYWDIK